jgi:hypothetical protein
MRVRERLGVTARRQRQVSRAMQLSLVGFLFVGIYELNVGVVVNAGIGLLITQLPAIIERDYDIPMDAGLTLWITGAVFLHAFGTVGLPHTEAFYGTVGWWDHLTHAVSSSVVAAAGYATVRAFDEHHRDIRFPPLFMFPLLLCITLAFGVFWELIEFGVSGFAAAIGSAEAALTIYGVQDTMLDLVYDAIGGVLVATWGTVYLTDVVAAMRRRLAERTAQE